MMAPDLPTDLAASCEDLGRRARAASRLLATIPTEVKNRWLARAADDLVRRAPEVLRANTEDLAGAGQEGRSRAQLDRLRLTPERIHAAAAGLREVAALPDPVGRILDQTTRPNGLQVRKVGVPLGVILFIYEARPSVTVDAAG